MTRPLERPTVWRLMTMAFGAWAALFALGYAAALLDPTGLAGKLVSAALLVAALALLWWVDRRARGREEAAMVRLAVIVAALASLFHAAIVIA